MKCNSRAKLYICESRYLSFFCWFCLKHFLVCVASKSETLKNYYLFAILNIYLVRFYAYIDVTKRLKIGEKKTASPIISIPH